MWSGSLVAVVLAGRMGRGGTPSPGPGPGGRGGGGGGVGGGAGGGRGAGGTVLDAVLERITYANDETGYTIARVAADRSGADLLTVVGALLGVQPGESLRVGGGWGGDPPCWRRLW